MRPYRPGARGCSDTIWPGGGALQAVLARFFSRHRAEVCPEARRPGDIPIPAPPSLSRVAQVGCPPRPPADVASDSPAFRPAAFQELPPGSNQMARSTRTRRSGLIQNARPRIITT